MPGFVNGGDTCPQEDSSNVNIVSDIAAFEFFNWDFEVSDQDLNGHGGFLLSDALKFKESVLEGSGRRVARPYSRGVSAI
jgi:hypothetical protein